ncbi:MAG: ABC transporter substrate-binding protein [Mycobacteriales bacterium]|nr:ABC transporter substrate-binding protein [Frankia sp.]
MQRRSRARRWRVLGAALALLAAPACTHDKAAPPPPATTASGVAPTALPSLSALYRPRTPAPAGLRRGGGAVVAVAAEAVVFDPFVLAGDTPATSELTPLWLPGLWRVGPRGVRTPWLAAGSPLVSRDGRRVSVDLRADAKWSDGSRITAADVAATWRYARRAGGSWRSAYDELSGVETPTPTRVVLVLRQPSVSWMRLFVAPTGVLPARRIPAATASRGYVPSVAGGPFVLATRTAGLGSTWRRTPAPWPGSDPALDRLDVRVVPDFTTARDLLARGAVDAVAPADAPHAAARLAGPGVRTATDRSTGRTTALVLRTDRGPLADVRVRRALALSFDRPAFSDVLLRDSGVVADDLVATGSPGYRSAFRRWRRDVARARQLLSDAGWRETTADRPRRKGGRDLALTVAAASPADLSDAVVRGLQLQARAVGVQLELAAADADVAYSLAREGGADLYYTRLDTDVDSDVGRRLATLAAPGGPNLSRWRDATATRLFAAVDRSRDLPSLDAAIAAAMARVADQVPVLPLYSLYPVTVARGLAPQPPVAGYAGPFADIDRWFRA